MTQKHAKQVENYSEEITIDRIACPLHVISLRKGLDKIKNNEVLKVNTGGKNVSQELTSACTAMGHVVNEQIESDDKTILYVHKQA